MRISRYAWHQTFCDEDCKPGYCRKHRLLYNGCQTAIEFKERDEYGFEIQIFGGNECPKCVKEYEDRKFVEFMEKREKEIREATCLRP